MRTTIPIIIIIASSCAAVMFPGCAKMPSAVTPARAALVDDSPREPAAISLFPSDQAVLDDEAVARILSSKLELPPRARLALMKFPDAEASRYYGRYYWRDEDYLKLQQSQMETLSNALLGSEQIAEVMPLPSLMTPARISIPVLREAALRMQGDLLLIYRVRSDTYSQYRTFAKDKAKAYSTCEVVLLDVRTGLVPFARVVSRDRLELKQPTDLDLSETMRRAEQGSAVEAMKSVAEDLARFVKSAPKRGGP